MCLQKRCGEYDAAICSDYITQLYFTASGSKKTILHDKNGKKNRINENLTNFNCTEKL